MKNYLLIFLFLYNLKIQAQQWEWAKVLSSGYGGEVKVDVDGNRIVVGAFSTDSISFGSITLHNAGGTDIFIVKYDPLGNIIWAKSAGGNLADGASSITTDSLGNIFITGAYYSSSIDFGSSTLYNASVYADVFIVKYDAAGNCLWARSGSGTGWDTATSLASDVQGNVIVAGIFHSPTISFGSSTLNGIGYEDVFIVKYNTSGNVLWAKAAGGSNYDWASSVSTDPTGNIFLGGDFSSPSITFGSTTLTNPNSIDRNIFLVKYDTAGNVLWAKQDGGTRVDNVTAIQSDLEGNIYVAGNFFSPTLAFGSTTLIKSGEAYDIFLTKYDAFGNALWAKSAGGGLGNDAENVHVSALSNDNYGNIIMLGNFDNRRLSFDSTTTLTSKGWTDLFIVKYDHFGNLLWGTSVGGILEDVGTSIYKDENSNFFITGYFNSPTIAFGTDTLVNPDSTGAFLAKLGTIATVIKEFANNEHFAVHPNPSSEIFIVDFKEISATTNICIYDLLGKCLFIKNYHNESTISIDLSNKPKGVYFIEVVSEGVRSVNKIVLQ